MLVNEIFKSIEGEGVRAGYPTLFIRLFGCNLGCSYCDTRYSCSGTEYTEKSPEEIVEHCKRWYPNIKRVTLTGGEPLIHRDIRLLIYDLTSNGYEVNIETNGSIDIEPYARFDNVIITMDWKSPSSGMNELMCKPNLALLRPQDVLKFVVGSTADLFEMSAIIVENQIKAQKFVSPVFNKIQPVNIAQFILARPELYDCRLQVQLHKIVWEPSMRGV